MINTHRGILIIPYRYVNTIENGMTVNVEFDGHNADTDGVPESTIVTILHTPHHLAEGNIFTAPIKITDCKYQLIGGMTGTAAILVSNESVLQMIIKRITNII